MTPTRDSRAPLNDVADVARATNLRRDRPRDRILVYHKVASYFSAVPELGRDGACDILYGIRNGQFITTLIWGAQRPTFGRIDVRRA